MDVDGKRLTVPLHPALLGLLALLAGLGLRGLWPASLGLESLHPRLVAGGLCFGAACLLGAWAFATLRRHATPPDFGEEVVALAVDGPYRFTRNPLYLALALTLAGTACLLDSAAMALAVPALLVALDRLVIPREERFLATRFGVSYAAWSARVRRWL